MKCCLSWSRVYRALGVELRETLPYASQLSWFSCEIPLASEAELSTRIFRGRLTHPRVGDVQYKEGDFRNHRQTSKVARHDIGIPVAGRRFEIDI